MTRNCPTCHEPRDDCDFQRTVDGKVLKTRECRYCIGEAAKREHVQQKRWKRITERR